MTRQTKRRGCPSGKACWATEKKALQILQEAREAELTGRQWRQESRVYQCPICGSWHLTSKSRGRK